MDCFQNTFAILGFRRRACNKAFNSYSERVQKILPSCQFTRVQASSKMQVCFEHFAISNRDIFQCFLDKTITSIAGALRMFDANCAECQSCVSYKKAVPYEIPLHDFFSLCRIIMESECTPLVPKVKYRNLRKS